MIGERLAPPPPPHTHTCTNTQTLFDQSLMTFELISQALSIAAVTAGGAASVRKESQETNVTSVSTVPLEQLAVPRGKHIIPIPF